MKKTLLLVMAAGLIVAIGCGQKTAPTEPAVTPSASVSELTPGNAYVCPMHPQVVSGSPGVCQICNMNLVENTNAAVTSEPAVPSTPVQRTATEAEIGTDAVCPVTGEDLKVKSNTPVFDYRGKTYYMCCNKCIAKFAKDPEKYLSGKSDDGHADHNH